MPAVLVGWTGTPASPTENEEGSLDVRLLVAVEVLVRGQYRRDTLRRRDWMAWTVIECLLQRTPRRGPVIDGIALSDVESFDVGAAKEILATARVMFEVTVPEMVSLAGMPADGDESWPPGTPGGPPPDGEPYTPPEPLPLADEFTTSIIREAID
jgi:hypothetical protein